MTNKVKFAELMQFLAIGIKGQELTKIELQAYWFALADEFENIKDFEIAVKNLLKRWNYSYMPKPSHFINAVNSYDDITLESIAESAWNSVIEAIEKGGGYNKIVEFEDKIIKPLLNDFGGLNYLSRLKYKDLEFIKKDFINAYCRVVKGKKILKEKEDFIKFDEVKKIYIKANYSVEEQNKKVLEQKKDKENFTNLVKKINKF